MSAPIRTPDDLRRWPGQSLAQGVTGTALLHIECAHLGAGSWQTAHSWVTEATRDEISAADDTGLFFGAPALAYILHAAGADGTARYGPALADLDAHLTVLTHRRLDAAHARIDRRDLPAFAEYDLLRGLTGLGAHLLAHAPGNDALGQVLTYLVRLTQPLRTDSGTVPGWWVFHDPHQKDSFAFPGGHSNFGLAHGISGPLALLAQSLRRGITVDGHLDAIAVICAWLDTWRQDADTGPWWPQWITRDELRTGQSNQHRPLRPSWCYGTPGLARAQQLVGITTEDLRRQQVAEHALAGALSDPAQLARIIDTSLCHGWAGLYQTVWRAARDALDPKIGASLPHLADHLACPVRGEDTGFLEGDAGADLALHTATRNAPPVSGWDACLLINSPARERTQHPVHADLAPDQTTSGVLEVLAGIPLDQVAARASMNPADLADAVEVYHAAGQAALHAHTTIRDWFAVRFQPTDWDTAEHATATHVGPQLHQAQATGVLAAWWFVRKHPCWRLRLHPGPTTTVTELEMALGTILDSLTEAGLIDRWWTAIYEPEVLAFGGPRAMSIAHNLFHTDSRSILDYVLHQDPAARPEDTPGRRELSVLLCSALFRAAGQDWYEQGDIWDRVTRMRPLPAGVPTNRLPDMAEDLRRLMAVDTAQLLETGPLSFAAQWAVGFRDAGRALADAAHHGALLRGMRDVLAHHVIFHWNRLGLHARTQAILARAARDTVMHPPNSLPGARPAEGAIDVAGA